MQERPEKAICELAVIAVHVFLVEEYKSHVEVIFSISKVQAVVLPDADVREELRGVPFFSHSGEKPCVVASGHINVPVA